MAASKLFLVAVSNTTETLTTRICETKRSAMEFLAAYAIGQMPPNGTKIDGSAQKIVAGYFTPANNVRFSITEHTFVDVFTTAERFVGARTRLNNKSIDMGRKSGSNVAARGKNRGKKKTATAPTQEATTV